MTLPDKDSFSTYGGVKFDFIDVVDPTTDRSATEVNGALASVSMMTRTALRAVISFAANGLDGYNNDVYSHESVWGNGLDVLPTLYHNSVGLWTITWPATVDDPLGESHDVSFKYATADWNSGTFGKAQVLITSPNVVQVFLFDAAGTGIDAPGSGLITVFLI